MSQDAGNARGQGGRFQEISAVGAGPIVAQPSVGREVRAAPGWPPIAIPGRPGWYRHLIDGRQVDLPREEAAPWESD